jgi:hypothetical protein
MVEKPAGISMKKLNFNWRRYPLLNFVLLLIVTGALTSLAPAEKSLGTNVRVVYLHGAWVWVALAAFVSAGGIGLAGLLTRRVHLHTWSRALGRTGLFFWITYLPISLWAMQTNWNGLFLAEPRWRLAVIFALGGLAVQIGLTLMDDPGWASAANSLYVFVLFLALRTTQDVMHPGSPIFNSDSRDIQVFFTALLLLTCIAAWQITRWWHKVESVNVEK